MSPVCESLFCMWIAIQLEKFTSLIHNPVLHSFLQLVHEDNSLRLDFFHSINTDSKLDQQVDKMNLEDKKKTIISILNSRNFHLWIKKVKDIVYWAKIWEYVDSESDLNESEEISFFHYFHYSVLVLLIQSTQQIQQSTETVADDEVSTQQSSSLSNQTIDHRSAMSLSELSKSQKKKLTNEYRGFRLKNKK